jgi:hypothetical protein
VRPNAQLDDFTDGVMNHRADPAEGLKRDDSVPAVRFRPYIAA